MIQSLLSHWRTGAGLLGFDILVWLACRVLFLSSGDPDLWQKQIALLQALLVLDTLLVIWWYTDVTAQVARTSEAHLQHAAAAEHIRNKPFAVGVRNPIPSGGFEYCVRNAGGGVAVSIWWVTEGPGEVLDRVCLGALGPGDARALPENLLRPMCDQVGTPPFALLAEGVYTRTAQWTMTTNLRGGQPGTDVFSQFVPVQNSQRERSVHEVVEAEAHTIRSAFAEIVRRSAPANKPLQPTSGGQTEVV